MKTFVLLFIVCSMATTTYSQAPKVEFYDLIKKLLYDSTGYDNVGDWAVGQPKKYPVKWKADQIEMSEDTSINFYRQGEADITLQGRGFMQADKPLKWNIMLKGPRMGYGFFSIISGNSNTLHSKYTIDSLFGKKPFKAKLLKSCDAKELMGFYYYEIKLPKKDVTFLKCSWLSNNGSTAIRIDVYDSYYKYAAKLNCPN